MSVEVDAPPDRVWKIVADPHNLPKWDHHILAVDGVPKDGLKEGTRYRTWIKFMGVRAKAAVEVLSLQPERYSMIRLDGLLEGTIETWLVPVGADRTNLRHRVDYRFVGGPLGRLAARGVKLLGASFLLRRGTLAQKRQAESRSG